MKMPFLLIRPKIVLKNLLIKKGGCFEYHAVIADKIEYRYIHRASICLIKVYLEQEITDYHTFMDYVRDDVPAFDSYKQMMHEWRHSGEEE